MKKLFVLLVLFIFPLAVFADAQSAKTSSLPQGYFKKKSNGEIIQYNKNGKKIGVYKLRNGKYVQVK